MTASTKIEWTEATWNPVTGCTKVSAGCDHCYAQTFAERWRGVPGHPFEQGFDLRLWPERLTLPLRWRRPRQVFVNSMSDLFIGADRVPDAFIARVFAVMAIARDHTFQVLTKRPARMRALLSREAFVTSVEREVERIVLDEALPIPSATRAEVRSRLAAWLGPLIVGWPLPNVMLGVSIEAQKWAQVRLPLLKATPAAVRFVSCEPLLGPLDLRPWLGQDLDWVIAGGESGPGHRPMDLDWVRSLRDQCLPTSTAFFFKQVGGRTPKAGGRVLDGRTWDEVPVAAPEVSS